MLDEAGRELVEVVADPRPVDHGAASSCSPVVDGPPIAGPPFAAGASRAVSRM